MVLLEEENGLLRERESGATERTSEGGRRVQVNREINCLTNYSCVIYIVCVSCVFNSSPQTCVSTCVQEQSGGSIVWSRRLNVSVSKHGRIETLAAMKPTTMMERTTEKEKLPNMLPPHKPQSHTRSEAVEVWKEQQISS